MTKIFIRNEYNKRLAAGFLAVVMALAGVPAVVASAADAPAMRFRNVSVQPEEVAEDRNVGIDFVLSGNQKGFRAVSFGVRYDESLSFTDACPMAAAGEAFDITCNPDEHLLWFTAAAASGNASASVLQDEPVLTLYFDVAEETAGGNFDLELVYTGLDGSSAYWYTDTLENVMDTVQETSSNGRISLCNPDAEAISHTELTLNPDAQQQLEVINASDSVFWFSSNPKVASVSETGLVTAESAGECQIQAYVNNHLMSCNVTVSDTYRYNVTDGAELTLTDSDANVVLQMDGEENITWISANPDILTVDSDGTVHILRSGITFVIAISRNGKAAMKVIRVNLKKSRAASYTLGDVDNNGKVDILDVVLANQCILGKKPLTDTQYAAADINADGVVAPDDSLNIMKMVVGLL